MTWRFRLAAGVCGGLLVALATLFVLTSFQVELRQTGGSAGKSIFFGVWSLALTLALALGRPREFMEGSLTCAGALFVLAAAVSLRRLSAVAWSPGVLEVSACLLITGLVLCATGPWLYLSRRRDARQE